MTKKLMKKITSETQAEMSRREFLSSSIGMTSSLILSGTFTSKLFAASATHHTLVQVFLRGAIDPLSLVAPKASGAELDFYKASRPNIGIPKESLLAIPGESIYGLNPNAAKLKSLMDAGRLRMILGYGSENPTTSHFAQQDCVEYGFGAARDPQVSGGFLNRAVYGLAATAKSDSLPAASIGVGLDKSLTGAQNALAVQTLGSQSMYGLSNHTPGLSTEERTIAGYSNTEKVNPVDYHLASSGFQVRKALPTLIAAGASDAVLSPDTGDITGNDRHYAGLNAFPNAVKLMKTDPLLRVITINVTGWDDHFQQKPMTGKYAERIKKLSFALEAFIFDLNRNGLLGRTSVVVHSEFGRTVKENATEGSDHGRGGIAMVLGANVGSATKLRRPAKVLDSANASIQQNVLPVIYDYRQVLAEVLVEKMGVSAASLTHSDPKKRIFPGLVYQPFGVV
jgi:uncharacterized protein (DUF1501 family)